MMVQKGELHKGLGLLEVFCIATGAMISSGLFVLPGMMYAKAGSSVCLIYLFAGFLVLPALFCKAELATAMPKAGGDYFFVDRSLGAAFGTLAGVASWFELSLKSAFALFGVGAFGLLVQGSMPIWMIRLAAVVFCLLLTGVNLRGSVHTGRLQIFLVLGLLVGLLIYLFSGLSHMKPANFGHFNVQGWKPILSGIGMVFVSYGGLTKVASVAEEVRNPGRNLPLGMFLAFGVVTLLYFFVVMVTVGLLGDALLGPDGNGDLNPLIHGAQVTMGLPGAILLALAAFLAYLSTANAGILAASRIPLAMGRDQLLPEAFTAIHYKTGVPRAAVWFTSLFMVAAILFLELEMLVKVASTMKILVFLMVTLAVILMRESRIENYQPVYRCPAYPWVPIAGIVFYIVLVVSMGWVPLTITAVFFGGSLLWYGFYGRIRVNRESALIRVAKRIVPFGLASSHLDEELRDILRERDGLTQDRFDRLVQDCPVLDLEGTPTLEAFFEETARALSTLVDMDAARVLALLKAREAESSTILKPGLAIPHVVLPGTNIFHVVLVRCKEGIINPHDADHPVHAAFVLAGSPDLRNYHLRVLMFIAQITHDISFEDRWLRAATGEDLRNLILLAQRTRFDDELETVTALSS